MLRTVFPAFDKARELISFGASDNNAMSTTTSEKDDWCRSSLKEEDAFQSKVSNQPLKLPMLNC